MSNRRDLSQCLFIVTLKSIVLPSNIELYTGWPIKNAPSFECYHFRKVVDKHLIL